MDKLLKMRKKIDMIDKKLAKLFSKRMDIVDKISVIKKNNDINLEDKNREKSILEKNKKFVLVNYHSEFERFIKEIISISKDYQQKKNNKTF